MDRVRHDRVFLRVLLNESVGSGGACHVYSSKYIHRFLITAINVLLHDGTGHIHCGLDHAGNAIPFKI